MTDYQREIDIATGLARHAGRIILGVYATDFSVGSKGKAGPVTEADLRASRVIVDGLRKEFPGDGVVSEEEAAPHAPQEDRVWYVDPLDGTKEFVSRNDEFAVMIGLAVGGRAVLGVVHRPVTGTLYTGIADQEAWREQGGDRTRLAVSTTADPSTVRLAVSRSHRHPLLTDLRAQLGITEEVPCGSVGLKVGLIAERRADVYLDLASYTHAWDTCGPEAILRGAGGLLTDLGGEPLVYGGSDLRNRKGLLGTNGACHDLILRAIKPILQKADIL